MTAEKVAAELAVAEARKQASEQEILTITRGGVTTRVRDQGGLIAAAHRMGAFYEQAMLTYIASLGLKGVYLDVGANVGNHTLFFAQHCPSTAVHAFEPLPHTLAHLAENVALNGVDKVRIHPHGLADAPRRVTMRMSRREYAFECRTLDSVEIRGPVVVVKVDIEGMEVPFLKGARRTLRRYRPVLFAEAGSDPEYQALCEELRHMGYRPTGRVFNSTPTYEFSHVSRIERIRQWAGRSLTRRQVRRRIRRLIPETVRERRRRMIAERRR